MQHAACLCDETPFIRKTALDGRKEPTKHDCLNVSTGDEASAVLRHLLSSYPELIPAARKAADALLAKVSFTDIARSVFEALIALDLGDLDAGPRAAGYVEPK